MKERSDSEVPLFLLNLLELLLMIQVLYPHQVVENHLELNLVQVGSKHLHLIYLCSQQGLLYLNLFYFVVPLISVCKWTRTITTAVVMCIHMQYFYHDDESQDHHKDSPWGFKVLHLEVIFSTYFGAVCVISIFISNE